MTGGSRTRTKVIINGEIKIVQTRITKIERDTEEAHEEEPDAEEQDQEDSDNFDEDDQDNYMWHKDDVRTMDAYISEAQVVSGDEVDGLHTALSTCG